MKKYKIKLLTPDVFSTDDLKKINRPVLAFMAGRSTMHNSEKTVEQGKSMLRIL